MPKDFRACLAALRAAKLGALLETTDLRAAYARDASIFFVPPLAVLRPRGEAELAQALALAADAELPVTVRGAGSSRAGQALGTGLILDLSEGLRAIVEIDAAGRRARVQPGVVAAELDRALQPLGLFFPPDPSSAAFCTLGGMVGNNAGGARALRYGSTVDHLRSVRALGVGGRELSFGPAWPSAGPLRAATDLLERERDRIAAQRAPRKTSSGYCLRAASSSPGGPLPAASLLAGSEGTLAVATEIEISLLPRPQHAGCLVVELGALEDLAAAQVALSPLAPSRLELLDRALLERAAERVPEIGAWLERPYRFMLIAEAWEASPAALCAALDGMQAALPLPARRIEDAAAQRRLWDLRARAVGFLARVAGPERPIPLLEDLCVPPARLAEFLPELQALFAQLGVEAYVFGHAGDGNLHVNVRLDLSASAGRAQARALLREGHELVRRLGGSLSGEHGDGRLRSPFLPRMFGALHEQVHVPLKRIFDPSGLLAPGILVEAPSEAETLRSLWATAGGRLSAELPAGLAPLAECHACGQCRSFCPPLRASRREELGTRARATLLRSWASEGASPGAAGLRASSEVLESCLGCGVCALECPSGVDLASPVRAAKELLARRGDRSLGQRALAAAPALGAALGRLPGPLRAAASAGPARRVAQWAFGIDAGVPLPALQRQHLRPVPLAGPPRARALYFAGCQGSLEAEGEGHAVLALLAAAGVEAQAPELPCCGLPGHSHGLLDRAALHRLLSTLAEWQAEGWDLVFAAPSCQAMILHEAPRLEGLPRLAALRRPAGIFEYLESLDWQPPPLEPRPGRYALHHSCHARLLGPPDATLRALRRIPEAEITLLPERCCGRAGTWGLSQRHRSLSLRVGEDQAAALRSLSAQVLLSTCSSCRSQLGAAGELPTLHPAVLVASSLRLVPEGAAAPRSCPEDRSAGGEIG